MSDVDENRADAYEAILDAMGDEKTVISPNGETSVITAYVKARQKEGLQRLAMITDSQIVEQSTVEHKGKTYRVSFQSGCNGMFDYALMMESASKRRDWAE